MPRSSGACTSACECDGTPFPGRPEYYRNLFAYFQTFITLFLAKALKDGEDLLAEKSKTKFFKRFPLVSKQLGEALSHLSLITDAINSSEEDAAICECY